MVQRTDAGDLMRKLLETMLKSLVDAGTWAVYAHMKPDCSGVRVATGRYRKYVISRGDGRAAAPWAAVTIGLSAHAAAADCLPALMPTLLVLPLALMAVRVSDLYLSGRGLVVRAAAGQALVHGALTLATPCTSHPEASGQSHVLPALDVVMTAAHVIALVLCVTAAAQLERRISSLLTQVAHWVRAVVARRPPPHGTPTRRTTAGHQRAGFLPTQLEHRNCGITRGPPRRPRCPTPA